MMKVEAIFGGVLALFVLGVAIYALATTQFRPTPGGNSVIGGGDRNLVRVNSNGSGNDLDCQCYNEAFKLAGSNVGVMSSQYRTGFEQCRAVGGVKGGDAWTAGWNARLSAKPYEASCRSYRKRAA